MQSVSMLLVLVASLVVYDVFRPFASRIENYMELASNVVLIFVFAAGVAIDADYSPTSIAIQVVQWCLFLSSIAVIIAFLLTMFYEQLAKIQAKIKARWQQWRGSNTLRTN
jgi:protein-S-isoprenylcysteine O-methyltransferase Ste14